MTPVFSAPRRLVSAGLAILLGVAFIAATLALSTSLDASLRASAAGAVQDASVVVSLADDAPDDAALTDALVRDIAAQPHVSGVRPVAEASVVLHAAGSVTSLEVQTLPTLSDQTTLTEGRLPARTGEIALDENAARTAAAGIGDTVEVGFTPAPYTVVGIVAAGADTTAHTGTAHAFAQLGDVEGISGRQGYTSLYVTATVPPEQAVSQLADLPAVQQAHAQVQTADSVIAERVERYTGGTEQLRIMLLAFAGVAVVVAGLVVANTFAILVAQRTRQLALFRTIGATRRQVFASVVKEAAALGVVASVLGVALGVGAVALLRPLLAASAMPVTTVAVTPGDLLAPLLIGVAMAVLAALVPARRATRVAPLAALRPVASAPEAKRASRLATISGALLVVVGGALLALGAVALPAAQTSAGLGVLVGMAGGLLSIVGVLLLGRWLAPAAATLVGRPLARLGGVPGDVALDSVRRNPGRAAATTGALLVGVSLVSMMMVGAASGQATLDRELDQQFPVDTMAFSWEELSPAQIEAAPTLPGVVASTVIRSATVDIPGLGDTSVVGWDADATAVLRSPAQIEGLADGVLVVGSDSALDDGQQIVVEGVDGPVTLTVRTNPAAGQGVSVTADTLASLTATSDASLGLRLASDVDPSEASARIGEALAPLGPTVQVLSLSTQRAEISAIIDAVLLLVIGLLGVAVVIALVGIGNTLGLSVFERRREFGLLRALGLTRTQLRAALTWEALLLAIIASLIGLALGTIYGIAGVQALLGSATGVTIAIPWGRLALVMIAAMAAAWLASLLPGIRAARVPPAAALALGE